MADLPRRKIDTDAVIRWVRMFQNAGNPDNANDPSYLNFGFNGTDLVAVDSVGNVYNYAAGAPSNAKYIVAEANGSLSDEVNLGALSSGILKIAVAAGIATPSIASAGTDYATPDTNCRVAVNKNSGATVGTRRRINFIEGSNVTLTVADDAGSEEVDVTIASAGGGASNSFETINCSSGTDPVADSATDTLNLTAGAGMVVTGDSSTDTVTFSTKIANGTFTGDGASTQAITGLGFQPRFIYINGRVDNTFNPFYKNANSGTKSFYGAPTVQYEDDYIISFDADGFTVGNGTGGSAGNALNIGAQVYEYFAWG